MEGKSFLRKQVAHPNSLDNINLGAPLGREKLKENILRRKNVKKN